METPKIPAPVYSMNQLLERYQDVAKRLNEEFQEQNVEPKGASAGQTGSWSSFGYRVRADKDSDYSAIEIVYDSSSKSATLPEEPTDRDARIEEIVQRLKQSIAVKP